MSIGKSIGWTDITRNPIKGRCQGGCWYCYYSGERGIMKRFKHNPKIRIECNCLMNLPKTPKKIFLCSTHDLFGHWIPVGWRDTIFRWVEKYPQHTFQVLTKFPQNIDRDMPNNVWLGTTVSASHERFKLNKLLQNKAGLYFASFEPLGGFVKADGYRLEFSSLNWMIVGSMTGRGKQYWPDKKWVEDIVKEAQRYNIPIFLKDNLKEIWGEPLIQEMPDES